MAKYLLLKHYRGVPERLPGTDAPMHEWTPDEISAHLQFMGDLMEDLKAAGKFVYEQALSPRGAFVRYDGEGRPPVTDGPFAETKDLIAGWMAIDVEDQDEAYAVAATLSSAPGPGGRPLHEWIEVRPVLTDASEVTDGPI